MYASFVYNVPVVREIRTYPVYDYVLDLRMYVALTLTHLPLTFPSRSGSPRALMPGDVRESAL